MHKMLTIVLVILSQKIYKAFIFYHKKMMKRVYTLLDVVSRLIKLVSLLMEFISIRTKNGCS